MALAVCGAVLAETNNQLVGTWAMVRATTDRQGVIADAYGPEPHGWVVFTRELTFVEVLTDPRVPKFASEVRGRAPMTRIAQQWPVVSASGATPSTERRIHWQYRGGVDLSELGRGGPYA